MRSGIVLVLLAATGLGSQNIKEHQEPQGLPGASCPFLSVLWRPELLWQGNDMHPTLEIFPAEAPALYHFLLYSGNSNV